MARSTSKRNPLSSALVKLCKYGLLVAIMMSYDKFQWMTLTNSYIRPISSTALDDHESTAAVTEAPQQTSAPQVISSEEEVLPPGFQGMLDRAMQLSKHAACHSTSVVGTFNNGTYSLPYLGIIEAFTTTKKEESTSIQCVLPPSQECHETQLTVVFMGYNPKWVEKLIRNFQHLLEWQPLVKEIILVWNNEAAILKEEASELLKVAAATERIRIVYSLEMGWGNSLFNRYNVDLGVTTKAIVYYDDDANLYERPIIEAAFELWKRNSNAQVGASGRYFMDRSAQNVVEVGESLLRHCPNAPPLEYLTHGNYSLFSNMVLPSGSFLHSNYLSCLSHSRLHELRQFVLQPPVFPDDLVVSFLVSQLSQRRPLTYSKKLKDAASGKKLWQVDREYWLERERRRLLSKEVDDWGLLRGSAATALANYFGSYSQAGFGWCYGTKYEEKHADYTTCGSRTVTVDVMPWMNTTCGA